MTAPQFPTDYTTDVGFDLAEDHIGPFYYHGTPDNAHYVVMADQRHCNVTGIVHGGVLMTLADYAACMQATAHYDGEDCVTVSFNSAFVAAAQIGELVTATAQVTRKTRSLAFVTGEIESKGGVVMTFSAVIKRLPRDA